MPANRAVLEQVALMVAPEGASVEHLGTGGFASTFKVTTADGADVYALKIVDAAISERERSERELNALQRVSHPNVVGYRGTGTALHDGLEYRWLAMNFVEGDTLSQVLAEGSTFNLAEAVDLVRQAVSGAAALWRADTSHRDLSPNNLLITGAGEVVVVDLGMARHLEDTTITTLPTPGTPGWMSPEQVGPTPSHGDWRSDQFVLGLIAYRLVTGVNPFLARNQYEAWMAPHAQTPKPPRDLTTTIPVALSDLIMKMLAKQPHRRYLRAAALLSELDQIAATLATAETLDPVTPRFFFAVGDSIGHVRAPTFVSSLEPDGILVEPRSGGRVAEVMAVDGASAATIVVDPRTHLARSPEEVRPTYYQNLPFGGGPALDRFADAADRRAFCESVLDFQLASRPDVVMAPYFFAGNGERPWIQESLNCSAVTRDLLEERAATREGVIEPLWTSVAVSAQWVSQTDSRDSLMTMLTSLPIDTLHLLMHTTQGTFATLGDRGVLTGLVDVLQVMREADVPVVLGRRSSEGLLGLALGATGWTTGVSGVQMNMDPHPETTSQARPGQPRIYVPQLLSHVTGATYVQFMAARPDLVQLGTAPGQELLARNPTLEDVVAEETVLRWQHNMLAMRHQARLLATTSPEQRIAMMRSWVDLAGTIFSQLPAMGGTGESPAFVDVWRELL